MSALLLPIQMPVLQRLILDSLQSLMLRLYLERLDHNVKKLFPFTNDIFLSRSETCLETFLRLTYCHSQELNRNLILLLFVYVVG